MEPATGRTDLPTSPPARRGGAMLQLRDRVTVRSGAQERRARKEQRRALRERDRRSAKLAELHHIAELLDQATVTIERGWIQHGWFAYDNAAGVRHVVSSYAGRKVSQERV